MGDVEPIASKDLVVDIDYGQFYLHTGDTYGEFIPNLVDRALSADGIAQSAETLVVVVEEQNNFGLDLRVERWGAQPDDDLDSWQEAFEATITVRSQGLTFESPTMSSVQVSAPPGLYRTLITGRGFDTPDEFGQRSATLRRIRLWPTDEVILPARLRQFTLAEWQPQPSTLEPPGTAAVRRIQHDLNTERALTGQRGTVTVSRTIKGSRRRMYKYFRHPYGWLTHMAGPGEDSFALMAYRFEDEANRIVPIHGKVTCDVIAAKTPEFAHFTWTWLRHTPDQINPDEWDGRPGAVLVPPSPQMTWRFDLTPDKNSVGDTTTVVAITHDQVPIEWVEDLTSYWAWVLERADFIFDVGGGWERPL